MQFVDTNYVKTSDGVYIAYQVTGDGPVDFVLQTDWPGNIDMEWEEPPIARFVHELESLGRVIRHDRRGIGLSSRDVPLPNLETRVSDLLEVLHEVGSERPVLEGVFESGAPNALLAATRPDLIRALVWFEPNPRFAWAPDYTWGRTPEDMQNELRDIDRSWGTAAYGKAFLGDEAARGNELPSDMGMLMAKSSRNACTPDVAQKLARIWYDTDVRGLLPSIQTPTLILSKSQDGRSEYVASLINGAEVISLEGGEWTEEDMRVGVEHIRRFIGAEPAAVETDRVLATVLFTDIVGSTEHLSRLGDARWKEVLAAHDERAKQEVERCRGTYVSSTGDGLLATFDGPARAVRCASAIVEAVRPLGIEIRAGCHTGEVEMDGDDVRGIAVHIGARVAALAGASEVYVSSTVKDITAGSGLVFDDAGEHELKGVSDRWRLYRVRN